MFKQIDTLKLGSRSKPLRMVHAANLQMDKDGAHLWNQDQKIHHGLIRLGHFVYTFSINDRARMLSPFGGKDLGKARANRSLVETCRNVHPDVLLLGHAQYVSAKTLKEIRHLLPKIRIGMWYVDSVWEGSRIKHLQEKIPLLDAVCCSTAGSYLELFATKRCAAGFIPSAVDLGIECYRAFETFSVDIIHDVLFFGHDKGVPERSQFLIQLKKLISGLRFGVYGSLGQPGIYGFDKEQIIRCSKMAINLSQRSNVPLYSSSRIAELMGNGILSMIPRGAGLEELYAEDEAIFFDGVQDLADKILKFSADDSARVAIAHKGWQRVHRDYNSKEVASFILGLTMRDPAWKDATWAKHVYIKS